MYGPASDHIGKRAIMANSEGEVVTKSPAELIDARIKELGDWRGETLARIRELIKDAVPDVIEEWK